MAVARFDVMRIIPFGTLTAFYQQLGSPLTRNWRMFKLTNTTNVNVLVSFDGTNDNIFIPAGSFTLYDLSTNAPPISQSDNFVLALQTQFNYKVESGTATEGGVYLEACYARGVP